MAIGAKSPTLAAGVVVVHAERDGYRYLLLRAYRYWDFPKGLVEPDETPLRAARREVLEETGLADLHFRWGENYRETEPYANNKVARYYLAESRTAAVRLGHNPALGKPEHHEYRWCDYESARRLVAPRILTVLEWAHERLQRAR